MRAERDQLRAVLSDPTYRVWARALQAEYARYDAMANGAELIERLVAMWQPVLRPAQALSKPFKKTAAFTRADELKRAALMSSTLQTSGANDSSVAVFGILIC